MLCMVFMHGYYMVNHRFLPASGVLNINRLNVLFKVLRFKYINRASLQ